MTKDLIEHLDSFRLSVLTLGGERYPALVKRWCNVLTAALLLLPHAVLFQAPPHIYDYAVGRYGIYANDYATAIVFLALSGVSWSLSSFPEPVQSQGHWWTACISGAIWANILWYLWSRWLALGGYVHPLQCLGFVPLFTSFYVPLRISSARRAELTNDSTVPLIVA